MIGVMKTLSTIAIVGLLVLAADIGLARATDSSATSGAGQAGRTLGSAIREAGIGAAAVGKQIGHGAANFGREIGAGATSREA